MYKHIKDHVKSHKNLNDETRINVNEISIEQINNLSKWLKITVSANQLTPRTTYAKNCLGFELQDISSYNYEWKHQPPISSEKSARPTIEKKIPYNKQAIWSNSICIGFTIKT